MKSNFVPGYKKIDDKGCFILDDDYMMSFSHDDGFSGRLSGVDLLINNKFVLNIFHRCFKLGNHYGKTWDDFHFKQTVTEIPCEILIFLEKIISDDTACLKDYYGLGGISMDDNPSQLYLFNNNSKTKAVYINGMFPLTDDMFNTDIEKAFFKFHVFITEWTNEIYENYVGNYSG